jgi:RNA polymerase sigma factor FliA
MTTTAVPAPRTIRDLPPAEVLRSYAAVVEIALRRWSSAVLRGTGVDRDDLRQEGLLALLTAAASFDPDRGVAFPTYARTVVPHAVAAALRRADPLPERVRADVRAVRDARAALGDRATTAAIAARAGITASRVVEVSAAAHRVVATSLHILPEWSHPTTASTAEDVVVELEDARALRTRVAALPDRHRRILVARLVHRTPVGVLASTEGVTPSRISQIVAASLASVVREPDQ